MNLDTAVARAVARAHLLETALHSTKAWYIEIGGQRVLAARAISEQGVSLSACFDATPRQAAIAALYEGREMRSVREVEPPEGEFCLTWDLALEETVAA